MRNFVVEYYCNIVLILIQQKFTFGKNVSFVFHIFCWCELCCNRNEAAFFMRRLRRRIFTYDNNSKMQCECRNEKKQTPVVANQTTDNEGGAMPHPHCL